MPHAVPDLNNLERVLLIKLSAIGDVVYALPVSAALHAVFPHLQLTWIVEERAAPLLQGNPHLHDVLVLPANWCGAPRTYPQLWRDLRARHFELTLDLQSNTRSALVAWASGAKYRYGCDWLRELAPLFLRRVPRRPESRHIVDQLLDMARFLGAAVTEARFPLPQFDADDDRVTELLAEVGIAAGEPFVAINPTGDALHKGWGRARWVGLLDELAGDVEVPIVLIGGPEDRAIGQAIMAQARRPPVNLIGRTTLTELVTLLRRTTLHLAGDTGSAHLAAALGTPVISIFGRNNPERVAPYGQADLCLHHREQCAALCRWRHALLPLNSNQDCWSPPPRCLAAVSVAEVAEAVRKCLGGHDDLVVGRICNPAVEDGLQIGPAV